MMYKIDEKGLDSNQNNVLYALRKNPKGSWQFADWEDSFLRGHAFDSEPIYSSINCDRCAKEFSSWKGIFGHMKCHSGTHQACGEAYLEDSQKHKTHDLEEGSESDVDIEIDDPNGNKWMKGKRFKRLRYVLQLNPREQFGSKTNNEEEDMEDMAVNTAQNPQFQVGAAERESGDLKLLSNGSQLPKCIRKNLKYKKTDGDAGLYDGDEVKMARYKCTTCNKVFHSHQALGGHRSAHKKVKGCFLQIDEDNESLEEEITDERLNTGSNFQLPCNFHKPPPKERTNDSCVKAKDETRIIELAAFAGKKTQRVHECSICHRVLASGQALGGHKSKHWGSSRASETIRTISSIKEKPTHQHIPARVELLDLDLNLPAHVDDDCDAGNLNNLGGNLVDSQEASYAQTHGFPYMQSWLIDSYPKQRLSLSNDHSYIGKNDEADGKAGKEIGFGRGSDSEFSEKAQSWLQL